MQTLISTQDAAMFLGITRPTVIKYIQEDRIKGMRVGKSYKIRREDLLDYAREIGMDASRLAGFDAFLKRRERKTRSLDTRTTDQTLTANHPSLPLKPEVKDYYYLAMRDIASDHEFMVRVRSEKFFIGRHSLASLSIRDDLVSSIHAKLLFHEDQITLLDQSTNGTRTANGLLLSGQSDELGDGDQFIIGNTLFTLVSCARIDLYLSSDVDAREFHDDPNMVNAREA